MGRLRLPSGGHQSSFRSVGSHVGFLPPILSENGEGYLFVGVICCFSLNSHIHPAGWLLLEAAGAG